MAELEISTEEIIEAARKAGRGLCADDHLDESFRNREAQADALARYLEMLVKWNRSMNLVGPRNWKEIFHSLIIDSLHLADFLYDLDLPENIKTLDLGAGAGLPGIPLRSVWQKGEYLLVEARQKRSIFMRTALRAMKLPRTEVFQGRAEKIPQADLPADLILSKAFMPWKELLPFVSAMLTDNGRIVILSNDPAPNDAELLALSFKLEKSREYNVGDKMHYFWALLPAS